ncbi:MarR family transcriptional regulator [Desulfovibrio sp.]|uniref:MarR family winged helix-turn-helix transcriptional regulator n=1 Tax=Desulfovibrio sp. TaxID=885 RepID=UPI0025BFBD60|nr:MarR family transcriptional regulator [Desulfovibrio sp.]
MQTENEKIESTLMALIERVTTLSKRPVDLEGHTLYRRELHVIALIGKSEGITGTELARFFGITRGVTHKILAQLEKKDLIFKSSQPVSSKNIALHLTDSGKKVFLLHEQYHKNLSREFNAYLSAKDASVRLEYIDFLEKILEMTNSHL